MAQGDPAGWKSLGTNDPTRYSSQFNLKRTQNTQQGTIQSNQSVRVITNRSNGNYDVYETNFGSGDRLIYSYNASNNKTTVANTGVYNQIFAGQNAQQLSNLNQGVRSATLKLAQNNVVGGSGSASNRDLTQLKNSPGYRSLSNSQPTRPAAPAPPGAPAAAAGGSLPSQNSPLPANQGNLSDPNSLPIQIGNMQGIAQQKEYGILQYPLYAEGEYDYLKVTILKYTRKGLTQRGDGPSLGNVLLPMQPNISDSNGVSWNEDRMNILQAQFGTAAYNAILKAGQVSSGAQLGQLISSFGSDMLSTIGSIANTPGLDKLIAGYFAGQAVQSNILGRASGAVINNNLELLFDGPKLRTFRYNFRFTPRDESEAMVVKEIIRLFKEEMAPDQTPGFLFLTSPNVFKLEYIYGKTGKQHPYLNVIKPCALTDFSVNYTPDGTYMTYSADEGAGGDGSMTSYTVDMQFSELDPIYKKDQQAAGGTGY